MCRIPDGFYVNWLMVSIADRFNHAKDKQGFIGRTAI